MRILVVEDEPELAEILRQGLTEEHYAVDVARDGEMGLRLAQIHDYDLVILDILLPKLDGLALLRELRAMGSLKPVLMLTAKDALDDRVKGLDSGADDYLTKPFGFEELLARIRALLRRGREARAGKIQIGDLVIDLNTHKVTRADQGINLTAKEYEVLEYLARHSNRLVSRTELSEHVWAGDFDSFSNIIDVFVYKLRQKIDRSSKIKLIQTMRGAGYILKSPEKNGKI